MKSDTPGEIPRTGATRETMEQWFQSFSNWGRWGRGDRLGALNLITPEKRVRSVSLVRDGTAVSLSRDAIKERVGPSAPFHHVMVEWGETPNAESAGDLFSVQYHGFTQTHLDALCHVFHGDYLFNGVSKNTVTNSGASEMSVLEMKTGIFTRGVLVDVPRAQKKPYLLPQDAIYPEHLDQALEMANILLEPGDALIVRTGRWARELREGHWDVETGSAGLHASCLQWLRQNDIALLASDLASDLMPSQVEGVRLPIHLGAIAGLGVPIVDNCDLENLSEIAAGKDRSEFLFVLSPLAVPGGTGSPVNPLAVF